MKRRPKGSGTIERTRDGRYRARFAFDGKTREDVDGSPFATHAEASRVLDVILSELAAAPVAGISLRRLGERALDQREKAGYRAIESDRNVWETHWDTWDMAGEPAKLITRADVRERLAGLRLRNGKPLAAQTKRNALNVLRAVFTFGVDAEMLDENPCTDIKVKDHGSTLETSTFLSRPEVDALLAAATDPAVAIAVGTGLRSGELRSLRWDDVRLDGAQPHLVVRFGKPDEPTKNGKIRHVPLFGVALSALQAIPRAEAVVLPSLSGWYRQKGRVVDPKDWKSWLRAAGITRRVRWHDLRHTCATLLLTGGWGGKPWSYEAVKDMLGHSSVKVTERYARSGSLAATAALAMAPKRSKNKPTTSPQVESKIVSQAREIVQRCRWDLNPHMPVLQTRRIVNDAERLHDVSGLARAYVEAVARGDAHAHTLGLELADAVWKQAERSAVAS